MVWTSNPATAANNVEISRSAMEVQSVVQRLIMHAVTDVLEEQGRRAGLFPAVISAILNQLSIQARYIPLHCEDLKPSSDDAPAPKEICFTSGNTVASVCDMPSQRDNMCTVMQRSTVPLQHRTISGTVSTTNIIMANWSNQMWQDVINKAARSLASGAFGLQIFGASVTVGS
ncbi:hypothetical protein KIN20_036917 [Parelaphostrongylus tenuis]|uniref:Uncharacterized protein n=1 Tax=Parelaphostrongylus tenuis TaxID=148309 RepID=A0AAD5RDQ3_PARTN|nr:hypothetical protein KIN20_036917 [Parelaphostrongylus tenuis]